MNLLDTSTRLVMKSKNTARIQAAASLQVAPLMILDQWTLTEGNFRCIALSIGGLPRATEQMRCYLVHPQPSVRQWTAESLNSKLKHKIASEEIDWHDDEQAEAMLQSFKAVLQR